ncbi:MAG: monofunctional biosynthetic peptidoglycan transglycosylase [Usitatibacter sp.]
MLRIAAWLAVALAAAFLAIQLRFLAEIWWWKDHNPSSTSFMDARLANMRAANPAARLQHAWVPYDQISESLKRAVVVAEDSKFTEHEGFDWEAIEKAKEKNRRKGKVVAGGSTISQQLAKNLFLSASRTPWRKGEEALITVMIEQVMDKRRILEIYLNVIEWGDGVFGAEAAARHYYGKSAAKLGGAEAAWLAAIVPNPRLYDRNRGTPFIQRKAATIVARMPAAELP